MLTPNSNFQHPVQPLLSSRVPGQAVMGELLRLQAGQEPQSRLARLFGVSPLTVETSAWYKGALGEIAVGQTLDNLGPEWTVLHAVPVGTGSSDIDHVVIGPPGVFTINTKNHSDQPVWVAGQTLMIAGKRQPHIRNATHEATRAARLLSKRAGLAIPVAGLVVIVDPKSLTIREKPAQVTVLTHNQLMRWLRTRKPVLSPDLVARVAAVAVLPDTWHSSPAGVGNDDDDVAAGFVGLRDQVRGARRRRVGWLLAFLAGAALAASNVLSVASAVISR